jgi:hypothetical protein
MTLGLPAFSVMTSATPTNYTASAVDGAIPATLNGITLAKAPSFSGVDDGISEIRSTITTPHGVIQLNHTGGFYGRSGNQSDLCFVGGSCSNNEVDTDKSFSLVFTVPVVTTAFASQLNPQEQGPATYTIEGPGSTTAQFAWDGLRGSNSSAHPTLTVSATNGSTLSTITVTTTQADGCTFVDGVGQTVDCYLYGLDIADAALGNDVTGSTTTTTSDVEVLAQTGAGVSRILIAGSLLLALGSAAFVIARRRTF